MRYLGNSGIIRPCSPLEQRSRVDLLRRMIPLRRVHRVHVPNYGSIIIGHDGISELVVISKILSSRD